MTWFDGGPEEERQPLPCQQCDGRGDLPCSACNETGVTPWGTGCNQCVEPIPCPGCRGTGEAKTMIERIRQGTAPWQKPWKPGQQAFPVNVDTGRRYTDGNVLRLTDSPSTRRPPPLPPRGLDHGPFTLFGLFGVHDDDFNPGVELQMHELTARWYGATGEMRIGFRLPVVGF